MDPQAKELNVLLRHVPRIVVSRFLRKPERLREPESVTFTGVVALFDISGFSSLGSKLSDDERDKIKAINKKPSEDEDDLGPIDVGMKPQRISLPLGLSNNADDSSSSAVSQASSVRFNPRDVPGNNDILSPDRSTDTMARDLMRQRRQSALASPTAGVVTGQRTVSFIGRAKPAAPQGIAVETLTTTLNKTLEPVIDVILQHGGDIIKFAGDALIVIWETEASEGYSTLPGILVHSALRCALEALRVLTATSLRNGHTSILGMHVGIGVSEVTGNHVGGVLDRWEFYLSGDANRQMSWAEQDAAKGEVVLSKEAYIELMQVKDRIGAQIDVDETLRGNFLIHNVSRTSMYTPRTVPPPKASLDLVPFLRGYVPGTISSYLRKGLAINPCTRNITAVFVKLEGMAESLSGGEQLMFIQRSLCLIQESAYKVQGTLRQFVIDDKGAVAIIVVGLPPFYHENNALRGVKLASYLLDKGIRASIGVTTGNAFCGSVGSHARAEYAVVGDVINLAARLMSAANAGDILCDEITRDDSKDSVKYDEPKEIPVKGKTTKVKVYRVERQQQDGARLDPVVLMDTPHSLPYGSEYLVESVPLYGPGRPDKRGNHHRVLIVTGESGTGKSMLLRHFQYNRSRSYMGSGDPVDSAMDFHAWGGIVKEMISRTVKTPKQPVHSSNSNNSGGPTNSDILVTGEDDEISSVFEVSTTSRTTEEFISSRTFQLKTLHQSRLNLIEGGEARLHSPSPASSTGRASGLSNRQEPRLVSSLTNSYDRVPVIDYLVLKRRVSRSLVPILNDLLPYDQLFQGSLDTLDKGEERTKALEALIFNIVEVVSAQKPILLIFDNAQWMDGLSWGLLVKVLDELPNVNALIATRAMHRMKRQPTYELLEQQSYVKKLEMRRFNYQVTSLFLCQQYHIAIMDTQVLDFVFARTDGNPAELIKLMDFMIQSRYISIDRASGSITILSDLDDLDMQVPQYTRAKVMSCIDILDGLAQMALKVISINPEPVEERMLNGLLTIFFTSDHDDSDIEGGLGGSGTAELKIPRSNSSISILHQVRIGLAECERESIITIDEQNKLLFFNSEEMRLVVYDTMLPSQRETIHHLYCQWFREATKPSRNGSISVSFPFDPSEPPSPTSGVPAHLGTLTSSSISYKQRLHQQLAMLGYHLSRSGNAKGALDAYQKAAENALEIKDLSFATDCMQSSLKILDEGPRVNKLNDLDYVLLRSKIEFLRGAIAIEKSEWDTATMHMSYIIRLCQRKGSVLRRYSSSIYRHESALDSTKTLVAKASVTRQASTTGSVVGPVSAPQLRLTLNESLWYMEVQQRCLPKLFNFQRLIPSGYPASLLFFRRTNTSVTTNRRPSRNTLSRMGSGTTSRVQPEETLLALNQVHFYKKKAEILIKKILISKKKQEEMSREIQRLTQKSLKTKQKQ